MELELKHLAPYLPYKLKYLKHNGNAQPIIKELESLRTFTKSVFASEKSKPILRPLSDLTEEYVSRKTIEDYNFCSSRDITKCLSYHSLSYLLSLHFDVFGLIEKGLAIDINTLKQ